MSISFQNVPMDKIDNLIGDINNKTDEKQNKDFAETEKKLKETKEVFKEAIKVFNSKMSLAKQFYDKQPIFLDDSGSFWLWNMGNKSWYRIEREEDIANLIYESLGLDTINSKERTEIFQALKQIGRLYRPIDLPSTWIQFKNGIVDINNESLIIEPTPENFTVNPIPWEIGNSIETPNMDRIFKEWVGEKYVKTLYQIIAYCLLPDYPLHRLFCFIGAGLNGKSKFLELLRKFIGKDNCCATELDVLLNSRFEITRLYKKLICQMGETNFTEISKTSILKKLTGDDLIGYEYKNKTPFEAKNYSKILISTNNLPTTSDKTIGFYRRWLIVDFPNQFSEKKNILDDIPEVEYNNLALKSIGILKELLEVKEFYNEGSIEDRTKRYEDHSDPIEKFLKEFTCEDVYGHIWKFEFEKKLNEWCKENRFRILSEETIGRKMKLKGVSQTQRMSDWTIDGQNKLLRCWIGLSWKSSFKDITGITGITGEFTSILTHRNEVGYPDIPVIPVKENILNNNSPDKETAIREDGGGLIPL